MNLGDKAKDKITGFQGIVTGYCSYISGCDQVLLSPGVKADKTLAEAHWFDVDRCEVVKAGVVAPLSVQGSKVVQGKRVRRVGPDIEAPKK